MSDDQEQKLPERYMELRELYLEDRQTAEQLAELEQFIMADEAIRRDFVNHMHQNASLQWIGSMPTGVAQENVSSSLRSDAAEATQGPRSGSKHSTTKPTLRRLPFLSLAGLFLMLALGLFGWQQLTQPANYAQIVSTQDCQWGECSQPTRKGTALSAGRLQLTSGIATLRFPNVDVTLEGQADIEIIDSKTCQLHSGRVFASVSPGGEGFKLLTANASFIDRGTMFGVSVAEDGSASLQVVKGQVDVSHSHTSDTFSAKNKDRLVAEADRLLKPSDLDGAEVELVEPARSELVRPIFVTTGDGRGDDAYVVGDPSKEKSPLLSALLIKKPANSNPGQYYAPWRRKAFMRFDLGAIAGRNIASCSLQLQGLDTGIGYRALMPDTEVAVYGLLDESQDAWERETINWNNCPARAGDTLAIDPEKSMLLGRFTVKRSRPDDRFEIDGERILEFLSSDSNGLATVILVPETSGQRGEAYVHGFASWRHASASPPTLRILLDE